MKIRNPFAFPLPVWDEAGEGAAGAAAGAEGNKSADAGAAGDAGAANKGTEGAGAEGDKGGAGGDKGGAGAGAAGDKAGQQQGNQGDWRSTIAATYPEAEREGVMNRLKRYSSTEAALKAGLEAQDTLRTRPPAVADKPPEDAKELAEWRKAKGVPENAEGYAIPDTIKEMVTEADKPYLDTYFAEAHAKNIPQEVAAASVEYYFTLRDQEIAAQVQGDRTADDDSRVELKTSWGTDYQPNMNLANQYAETVLPAGEDGEHPVLDARMPNGRKLRHSIEFMKEMAQLGLQKFGHSNYAGDEASERSMSRITELKGIMNTDIDRWNNSPELQKEYDVLLAAQARHKGGGE